MEIQDFKPDQSAVEEGSSDVEEAASVVEAVVDKPKKATSKKKAVVKRKKATARSKRPRQATKPVVEPAPVPLTVDEVRKVAIEAKDQLVVVALEPAVEALASWSETIRGAVGGFMDGLLGKKKGGN